MNHSEKEIGELEGQVYMLSRLKPDERLKKLSEIITRFKKILHEFPRTRKQHLDPVKQCLIVLRSLFADGHIVLISEKDRDVSKWCLEEIEYFLAHWDDL